MKHADVTRGYLLAGWLGLFCPSFTPSAHLRLVEWALLALLDKALKVFAGTAARRNLISALHGEVYVVFLNFKFARESIWVGMISYAQPGQRKSILRQR